MLRKLMWLMGFCPILFLGATTVQAVTIDFSSPQAGSGIQAGDTVDLNVTITNETAQRDIVAVRFDTAVIVKDKPTVVARSRTLRLKMRPGEVASRTMELTIPSNLPSGATGIVIRAVVDGLQSQTSATGTVAFRLIQ